MSEYIGYGIWALWAVFGFGVGQLAWRGRVTPDVPSLPTTDRFIVDAEGTAPVPTITTTSWTGEGPAPFRVVTLDGTVRYEGTEGRGARQCIEALRITRVEWRAYRDGLIWDWWPR